METRRILFVDAPQSVRPRLIQQQIGHGPNQGATYRLELPVAKEKANA